MKIMKLIKIKNAEHKIETSDKKKNLFADKRLIIIVISIVIVVAALLIHKFSANKNETSKPDGNTGTYTVTRSDLVVSVIESGDVMALNSRDIKSEVEGGTTIINIVDEGTIITEQDVKNGKILVELDSSNIEQKLNQQEVQFLGDEASYADANEALQIQIKQNESDIKAGQTNVKFALMDLHKYLGETVAEKMLAIAKKGQISDESIVPLLDDPNLAGEALQKIRDLQANIDLRNEELSQAQSRLVWTEKLADANYISKTDLEADQLKTKRAGIAYEQAITDKNLFIEYDFLKTSHTKLNDYDEAKRALVRIEARARSELAQKVARLKSNEATYKLQRERLEKYRKQFSACIIKAPAAGQVIYSSSMNRYDRRDNPIKIGVSIRERQNIISIPDTSGMKVEVKILENWIDKIIPGQNANIVIAAFPDEKFTGKVLRKAPMADPQDWFANPDLKVYSTGVTIDGTHENIKTGMSAKVEIIIDELKNVLVVPLQAVISQDDTKLCYVSTTDGPQKRIIQAGQFNDNFIEIKGGLKEGDKVLLNPPRPQKQKTQKKEQTPQQQQKIDNEKIKPEKTGENNPPVRQGRNRPSKQQG